MCQIIVITLCTGTIFHVFTNSKKFSLLSSIPNAQSHAICKGHSIIFTLLKILVPFRLQRSLYASQCMLLCTIIFLRFCTGYKFNMLDVLTSQNCANAVYGIVTVTPNVENQRFSPRWSCRQHKFYISTSYQCEFIYKSLFIPNAKVFAKVILKNLQKKNQPNKVLFLLVL